MSTEAKFEEINSTFTEEDYMRCFSEWDEIKSFISEKETDYKCYNCNTYWTKVTYVNDHDNICANCDTWSKPLLSNPINYKFVLRYIDPKWHEYILPDDLIYCKRCYETDLPRENYCEYCDDAMCESCLDSQYEISFHKCETCDRQSCYFNGRGSDYSLKL